jgi:uncharacterized protein YjiS (DUF1127 family)
MTFEHATYHARPLRQAPSLLGRLWATLVEHQRARRMHAEAHALDDRMLRDIGLSRYDLGHSRRIIP